MKILEFINFERNKRAKLTDKLICKVKLDNKELICYWYPKQFKD